MANAFKQEQGQRRREKLLEDCKAMMASAGIVGRRRAVMYYQKQAGVAKE